MMTKRKNQQIEMHLITIEDLVPMDVVAQQTKVPISRTKTSN
jgi:hypothetical protein